MFSADSNMNAETACEIALRKGLEGLAFTDHIDIDYPRIDFTINFNEYHACIKKLQDKFKGKLKIVEGLEVGMQQHVAVETNEIIMNYDFDFIIGSIHLLDRTDPYEKDFYENKTKREAYSKYLQEIIKGLSYFSNFDILGHMDFIIRFAPYQERSLFYDDFTELFDEIFKNIIQKGIGIEINTGSYRKVDGIVSPIFDLNILKRYKELGGEIVTIGSDSHSDDYIAYDFKYYIDLLKSCGFRYTAHFEGRKPIFEAI
jgi:histidinol-phosphatase (PHP family)